MCLRIGVETSSEGTYSFGKIGPVLAASPGEGIVIFGIMNFTMLMLGSFPGEGIDLLGVLDVVLILLGSFPGNCHL